MHKYPESRTSAPRALPVTAGRREVLVIELWAGPARRCPHRCLKAEGACGYTNAQGEDDELLPFVTA